MPVLVPVLLPVLVLFYWCRFSFYWSGGKKLLPSLLLLSLSKDGRFQGVPGEAEGAVHREAGALRGAEAPPGGGDRGAEGGALDPGGRGRLLGDGEQNLASRSEGRHGIHWLCVFFPFLQS